MNYKRQLAAIAGLAIAIISALELPAEARRYRGGYRASHSRQYRASYSRGMSNRGIGQQTRVASSRSYYRPASYRIAQIDRSGASAREASRSEAPRRRSIPQGDDRFPVADAPRRPSNQVSASERWGDNSRTAITETQVHDFRHEYAPGQSTKAMRSKLGAPAESYGDRDVWRIQRNGEDGKPSNKYGKLIATYDNKGKSYVWNAEW